MKAFLIILLLFFLLLIFPIKLKSKIIYNLIKNKGYLSFYFFNFKVLVTTWKVSRFKILIKNKNKKDIKILLFDFKGESDFKDVFFKQLLKVVKIKNFRTIGRFGIEDDCLISSLGSSVLLLISQFFKCYLIEKKSCNNVSSMLFADYSRNNFIVGVTASIKFNLLFASICAVKALYIKNNREKVYGK